MSALRLLLSGCIPLFNVNMTASRASLVAQTVKRLSATHKTQVQSLGWEDPLEKEMAAHSSILAWKIPWITEPGRLPSMGSQRVRHNWATSLSFFQNLVLRTQERVGKRKGGECVCVTRVITEYDFSDSMKTSCPPILYFLSDAQNSTTRLLPGG